MRKKIIALSLCSLLLSAGVAFAHPYWGPGPGAYLGAAVLGGVVGGAIAASAAPPRTVYVAPPPPAYYPPPPGYYYPPPPGYYYPPPPPPGYWR